MRNIRSFLLLCFVLIMILPSCAAVPEDVQQDVDAFRQAREEAEKLEKEMNFIPISDVYKNTPKTVQYKNGIVNVDAKVCVPQADKMYKLELAPNDLYAEKDALLKSFLDEKSYANWESLQYKDSPLDKPIFYNGIEHKEYGGKGNFFIEFGDNKELALNRCGRIFLRDTTKTMETHFFSGTGGILTSKTFFYDEIRDDFPESTVLDGKNCKAVDAWKQFGETVNYFAQRVPNFNYKPYSLEFYDNKEDSSSKAIVCRAVYEYNGVAFDPMCIDSQDKKNYDISRVCFGFYQNFHSLNDDCYLALRDSYKVTKELESYDKILDLDSAVKLLQASLAKERFANIDTIELMYGTYYYGDKGDEWANSYEEPPQFYAEPYWKFTERADGEDEENIQGLSTVHYVNAVTGEFYSYNSCMYFG